MVVPRTCKAVRGLTGWARLAQRKHSPYCSCEAAVLWPSGSKGSEQRRKRCFRSSWRLPYSAPRLGTGSAIPWGREAGKPASCGSSNRSSRGLPPVARELGLRKFQAITGHSRLSGLNGGNAVRGAVVMMDVARMATFRATVLWILRLAHATHGRATHLHQRAIKAGGDSRGVWMGSALDGLRGRWTTGSGRVFFFYDVLGRCHRVLSSVIDNAVFAEAMRQRHCSKRCGIASATRARRHGPDPGPPSTLCPRTARALQLSPG